MPAKVAKRPVQPQGDVALSAVLAAIQDLRSEIRATNERVNELGGRVDRGIPRMVPMRTDQPVQNSVTVPKLRAGESATGAKEYFPVTSTGQRVPDLLLERFPQRFGLGAAVRLRRDVPSGAMTKDGREITWGEILDKVPQNPLGEGEVMRPYYLSPKRGEWKYKVYIPGLTKRQGTGIYDSALEPATAPVTKPEPVPMAILEPA